MKSKMASGFSRKTIARGFLTATLLFAYGAFQPEPARSDAPVYGRYQVQPGDTLRSISERLLGDPKRWKELYELNSAAIGPDPNRLKKESVLLIPIPGERIAELSERPLEIPSPPPSPSPSPSPSPVPAAPRGEYQVKPGDTLIGIARRELGDPSLWRELYRLNRSLLGGDPAILPNGISLALPEKKEKKETIEKAEKTEKTEVTVKTESRRCYLVKKKDTLLSIARSELGDATLWKKLYRDNRPVIGKDPNVLKVGICLCLPSEAAQKTERQKQQNYVVKPGDTLLRIAGEVCGDRRLWREIYRLNAETIGPDPNVLRRGLTLELPK